jgi:hypothetical protein
MFDELGRRPSLLVKGKTFKDAELPLAVGIVVTLLLVGILLGIIS